MAIAEIAIAVCTSAPVTLRMILSTIPTCTKLIFVFHDSPLWRQDWQIARVRAIGKICEYKLGHSTPV
jgi:hypothetical protein